MRRFVISFSIVLLLAAMSADSATARGRNERGRTSPTEQRHRPDKVGGSSNRGKNKGNHKEDLKGSHKNRHDGKPGQGNPQHGHGGKPDKGHNTHGHYNPQRPHPGHHNPPAVRPGHAPQHPHGPVHHAHHGRPHRPYMYPHRPFHRPTPPPPAWRPVRPWRPFHTILGVTLGTTINLSINALLSSGYSVSGYDSDAVYLSNVPMLNYIWPAANLYYGSGGGLYGSEFVYSTSGFNLSRYNAVFCDLTSVYGSPYSVRQLTGGGRTAVWWGDGQYITLTYAGNYANNGSLRYYTTLSFGR